jgi:hypothetical protein
MLNAKTRLLPLVLPLMLLAAVLCSGCGKDVVQVSRGLASSLTPPPTPAPPAVAGRSEIRRVYIDASESMEGFASASASTPYAKLIEGLGYDLDGAVVYKYGQEGRQEVRGVDQLVTKSQFGRDLISPGFYDRDFNPDALLITHLAGEEQLAFSVLITDGVYSVQGGNNSSQVVEAIGKWLDRGGAFGIFALKSPFRGNVYAERRPVTVPNVSVSARPFYAFVFSPTVKELRNLEEKLRARSLDMLSFVLADDVVHTIVDFDEATKGTYSFVKPRDEPYHWHMLSADIFAEHNPAAVGYHVSYLTTPDYPASNYRVDLSADYYRWNRDTESFEKVNEGPPGGFNFKLEDGRPPAGGEGTAGAAEAGDSRAPNLTVFYPRDGGDYGFYHLHVLLSPKDYRPEIRALSTYDDDDPTQAHKTFRFYDLITSLTQLHFSKRVAPKVSPPLFATIANH